LLATILGANSKTLLIDYETEWFLGIGPLALLKEYKSRKFLSDTQRDGNLTVIEKTPRHVFRIPYIRKVYPDTRFIVMVRDPRDLVASITKRIGDFNGAIVRVRLDFEAVSKVKSHPDVLIIRYEDLVTNFVETLERISIHAGLKFEESMLNYTDLKTAWFDVNAASETDGIGKSEHVTRRAWQVKQPLFDGRGRYEKELSPEQLEHIGRRLGKLTTIYYPEIFK
jgi:hypothetical protein